MSTYTIGEVLPNGATVISDELTLNEDGSSVEIIKAQYDFQGFDTNGMPLPGGGGIDTEAISIPAPNSPEALQQQALQQFLALIPNLGPQLQQAQQDALNYATADVATQIQIVVRLIQNTAMIAEACAYAFTTLGLIPPA